ncbi:hypothetical protein [Variovorax sp. W2I14]|uniref:hypothetical protein n=1 Tax=Variovorax sp. W2I14 TaxID=3042290 RepID=UPI003D24BF19
MSKLKRYIGLLVAVFVLVLTFGPARNDYRDYYYPSAARLTFLTDTIVADLVKPEKEFEEAWKAVSDYMNRCPPFTSVKLNQRGSGGSNSCEGNGWIFSALPQRHLTELKAYEPDIEKLVEQYTAWNQKYVPKPRDLFNAEPARDPKILAIEKRIGTAEAKYLNDNKSKLLVPLYFLHGFLVLIALFIVVFREEIGALVLSPLTLLFGLGKVGTKAAKSLHDKV